MYHMISYFLKTDYYSVFKLKIDLLARCLKFCEIFFKLFSILQTLGTNTTKRQILSGTQLVIFAVATCKIFATTRAALKKNHFSV
jgi:hypothetical protein